MRSAACRALASQRRPDQHCRNSSCNTNRRFRAGAIETFETRQLQRHEPCGWASAQKCLHGPSPAGFAFDQIDEAACVEVDISHGRPSPLAPMPIGGRYRPGYEFQAAIPRSPRARPELAGWTLPRAETTRPRPRDLPRPRRARHGGRESQPRTTTPRHGSSMRVSDPWSQRARARETGARW